MSLIRLGCVCLLMVNSAFCVADDDDIDSLLKQVDSALAPAKESGAPIVPSAPRRATKRKTAPADPQLSPEPYPASSSILPEAPSTTRYSVPLDHSSLAELLKADTTSRVSDLRSPTQGALFRVSALAYGLGNGYVLAKDDDEFRLQGSTLGGVGLSFQPSWYLGILSSESIQTRLTFSLGAGAAYGNAEVVRTGVMSGRQTYSFFLIPVQTEVGMLVQLGKYFGLQAGYGYGVDLLNQRGLGVSDTTNAWFGSDLLSLTARFLWDSQTEVFASWSTRGIGILPRQESVSGFIARAGVGFHLGG